MSLDNSQVQTPEQKPAQESGKMSPQEYNFRALEAKLIQEREARIAAEKRYEEALHNKSTQDDDNDDEPFVDTKKLEKKLARFGEQTKKQTQGEIQRAVQEAIAEERKQNWLKSNPDFYDVLQHADKFAQKDPDLAESILEMPDTFERKKLVYKNIKALGLHKPEVPQSSIQDKIDKNKRTPYYQPSEMGTAPYSPVGDFSNEGKKKAYEKLQALKKNLRLS